MCHCLLIVFMPPLDSLIAITNVYYDVPGLLTPEKLGLLQELGVQSLLHVASFSVQKPTSFLPTWALWILTSPFIGLPFQKE